MIEMMLRIDRTRRRGPRGSAWTAEAIVSGSTYAASAYSGASYALARVLVDAGISDQSVQVRQEGIAGHLTMKSLCRMATRTIAESDRHSIGTRKWSEYERVMPSDAEIDVGEMSDARSLQNAL